MTLAGTGSAGNGRGGNGDDGPGDPAAHHPDLDLVLDAVREAAGPAMEEFRSDPAVRHKGPDQPVTAADLRANEVLADRLRGARPDYGWLSEESPDPGDRLGRDRVWIIDPIDGTRSFIGGYAEFGISVALAEGGQVVLGVIHNPASSELFWATRGRGAMGVAGWTGGRDGAVALRVADPGARGRPVMLASRTEIGRGEFAPFERDWSIRPTGSTAYKLALVAAGRGHAFLSRGPKSEWDVAAGALLVTEADGAVTDLAGAPLRFNRPDPGIRGIVAAAPALHAPLIGRAAGLRSDRLER